MAGWSSFNKYSLLGGLRSAAQVVSYEIPLTLSVVGIILLAGTLSLNQITLDQSGSLFDWYVFKQPLAFIDLLHRRDRGGEPDAVRPDRGGLGDRGRVRDRVLGDALRVLLLRRVRQRVHRLGPDRGALLRRLECAVRLAGRSGRSARTRIRPGWASGCSSRSAIIPPLAILALAMPFYLLNSGRSCGTRW